MKELLFGISAIFLCLASYHLGKIAMYQDLMEFREVCSAKVAPLETVKLCHEVFIYPEIK